MPPALSAVPHALHDHERNHNDQANSDHHSEWQEIRQQVLTKIGCDEDVVAFVVQIISSKCESVVIGYEDGRDS